MLNCSECYWCALGPNATDDHIHDNIEKVCLNGDSEHCRVKFKRKESFNRGCEHGETREAIDYKNMTAWEFANKYYM